MIRVRSDKTRAIDIASKFFYHNDRTNNFVLRFVSDRDWNSARIDE